MRNKKNFKNFNLSKCEAKKNFFNFSKMRDAEIKNSKIKKTDFLKKINDQKYARKKA